MAIVTVTKQFKKLPGGADRELRVHRGTIEAICRTTTKTVMPNDESKKRGHEGTAPKKGETEDADRMEGSFEPRTDDQEDPKRDSSPEEEREEGR